MSNVIIEPRATCTPNPGGQVKFAEDWEHTYVGLEGGWASGKTFIGARKLVTLHMFNSFDDNNRVTGVPSVAVAPTYGNAKDFDVPELEAVFEEVGLTHHYKSSGDAGGGKFAAPFFILPDLGTRRRPSLILIRTAERPERITGWAVGAAWGDEPSRWPIDYNDPKKDAFIQLRGRVRHSKARLLQVLFTYTNEGDVTRVFTEFHSGHRDHAIYTAPTAENPQMREWAEEERAKLPPELAAQYFDGEAITLRGVKVYSVFDAKLHVSKDLAFTYGLPLQWSFDFNIAPGMHSELGQYNSELDRFIVMKEFHAPRLDVRGTIEAFRQWVLKERFIDRQGGFRFREVEIFGDATGHGKWAGTGESCYTILMQGLSRLGIPYRMRVPRSNPFITDRINAFNVALLDIGGGVHWQCHPSCKRLITDLRDLKTNMHGEIDERDRRLSHPSSAEGYRIHYLRPVKVERPKVDERFGVSVVG